jgi:putative transposase
MAFLNSRLFFEIWLNFILDQSLTSMRDLFYRLNHAGISVDISTFSKASKSRQDQNFCRLYITLIERLKRQNPATALMLMPIDSTIITLTSKLFRMTLDGLLFTESTLSMIPENTVGIMDRGFASWDFLDQMSHTKTLFVVRIKNNIKTKFDHQRYRVVWFCDVESRTEYRLAINVNQMSKEEVSDPYRQRWQIEVLWEFLKMHLKLDKLITKNVNGVRL